MNEKLPSEVRTKVLEEHAALREHIAALRVKMEEDDDAALLEGTRAFFDALLAHLDSEDRMLVPTLATIDAWGPERARRLSVEHASQREWVKATHDRLGEGQDLRGRLADFLRRLEKDMEVEESSTLDPKLFREYPFPGVDMGGA